MTKRISRAQYHPSGGVRSLSLPLVIIGLACTSIAVSAFYFTLLSHGWYIVALSIVIPVMASCGFIRWAIRYSHCRNRVLAATLGICCGLAGYIGHFHIDQCVRWGAPWAAVDRLPGYLAFRMETDQWTWFSKGAILTPQVPAAGVQPAAWPSLEGRAAWNWRLFLLETLGVVLAPLATALHGAGRPYSERWRRWCDSESIFVEKKAIPALRKALDNGTLEKWVESAPKLVSSRQPHGKLTLWYAPSNDPDEGMTDVLLAVNDGPRLRLKSKEASAFLNLVPAMRVSTGMKVTGDQPNLRHYDTKVAHIWRVPKSSRKKRLRLGHEMRKIWKGLRIALPTCALFLVLIGGTWCLHEWVVKPGLAGRWILPTFIALIGVPLAIKIGKRLAFQRLWQTHLDDAQHALLQTIAARHDALVRANDPKAIYAEMLPRRLWESGRNIAPTESNEGLMRFDENRRAVLFEGENERFILPADSILKARIESLPGVSRSAEGLWGVVLIVKLEWGIWELPFFPLRGLPANNNWQRAAQLQAALEELCGRQLGDEAIEPSELEPAGR
jgi:hypothetical protein